ncbi:MAG: CopG family ribbon-helix-helix protein [Nitrospirae bacterium]|nr:CopG family ribbon-helix-helix protein [Nitrospirota bacterium]MCL5237057.1 CopG family ribbon-helix-helix protein [Nitrospirota bacterium]
MGTTTLTIRIDEQTKNRLDRLAKSTSRSKSYLVAHAIEDFLSINEWQVQETLKAIKEADRPGAQFIDHEKVAEWLDTWGTDNEQGPPK